MAEREGGGGGGRQGRQTNGDVTVVTTMDKCSGHKHTHITDCMKTESVL